MNVVNLATSTKSIMPGKSSRVELASFFQFMVFLWVALKGCLFLI